ncbi:MAG: ATP-binding protein [Desulfamplus sp.]|nr:ATP-binding protein [Desulfamplus sp.]
MGYEKNQSGQIVESDQTLTTIQNYFNKNNINPDIYQQVLMRKVIKTESSVYLFGESGTGKTTALQMAIKALENEGKKVLFMSNDSESGTTLDSIFNLSDEKITFDHPISLTVDQQETLDETDVLVVDNINKVPFDRFYACYLYASHYTTALKPQPRWIVSGVFDRNAHYFKMFLNVELKRDYRGHHGR